MAPLLRKQAGSGSAHVSRGPSPPDLSDLLEGFAAGWLGLYASLTGDLAYSSTVLVHHPQLGALHLCMAAAIF